MTTKLTVVYGSPHPKNPFFKSCIEQHVLTTKSTMKLLIRKSKQWEERLFNGICLSYSKLAGTFWKTYSLRLFCSHSWLELIYFRLYVYDSLIPHMIRWGVSATKKIESQTGESYLWRESKILLHSLSHMSLYNMLQVRWFSCHRLEILSVHHFQHIFKKSRPIMKTGVDIQIP